MQRVELPLFADLQSDQFVFGDPQRRRDAGRLVREVRVLRVDGSHELEAIGEIGDRRRAEDELEVAAGALLVEGPRSLVDAHAERPIQPLGLRQIPLCGVDACARRLERSLGHGQLRRHRVQMRLERPKRDPALPHLPLHGA